jgi:hypothetical protein
MRKSWQKIIFTSLVAWTAAAAAYAGDALVFHVTLCGTEQVCINWSKVGDIEIEKIDVYVFEGRGAEKVIGQFRISNKANKWESVRRKSFYLAKILGIDIRHPEQWGDARVLTPGYVYVMRFVVSYRDAETQNLNQAVQDVPIEQLAYHERPNRPEFSGDFNLIIFCVIVIAALFIGAILWWLCRIYVEIAAAIFRTLRRDTDVKQEVLSLAREQESGFWPVYVYVVSTYLLMKVKLPSILGMSLGEEEDKLLEEVVRNMRRMRPNDWPVDKAEIIKQIEQSR